MSLHALAGHMSAKGRGPDSMLVHMTPREVASLQALAERNGTSLTINPETGLPEAFKLKDLLPALAGVALGPAGFGLMSGAMAGLTVGGITTLATGSLSRGLMAGMGAYGASGLAEGLMGAGAGAAQNAAMSGLTQEQIAAQMAEKGLTEQGVLNQAAADATSKYASSGFGDRLTQGASAAMNNPKGFVEGMGGYGKLAQSGLAAISPIMADQGVQTATQRPSTPANIRRYSFDPYGGKYTSQGMYPAEKDQGMAQGGIVALAAGGDYRSLTKDSSADDIASAYKQFTATGGGNTQANQAAAIDYLTNLGIGQDKIGQAYSTYQAAPTYTDYTQQNVTDYLQANPNINIAEATKQFNVDPRTVNQAISQLGAGFLDPTQTAGGSGSMQYYDAFSKYGIDPNELFAANQALNPGYSFAGDKTAGALSRAFDVAGDFKGFNPTGETQALKDVEWVKKMDTEGANAVDIARLTGLSIGEVQARESAARLLMSKKVGTGNLDKVDILPGGGLGVSGGGNTVVNPNGTITTTPNIPGRPDGGFTGMGQVKDVYTQGGGSLGYTNKAPKTIDEFNQRFNKQTGSSLAAYDYLMGKGAYPTNSSTAEIMRPYSESALGITPPTGRPTQKYIYDARTKTYKLNPDFIPVTYDSEGKRVVGVSDNQVLEQLKTVPVKVATGGIVGYADGGTAQESVNEAQQKLNEFLKNNNVSYERIASLLGISVPEAKKRYPMASPAKAAAFDINQVYGGGDGAGGFAAPGTTGASGVVGDSNSVTNGGLAAAMDALGLSQDPSSVGVVSMGETGFAADAAAAAAAADNGQAAEGGNTAANAAAAAADASAAGEGAGAAGGGNAAGGEGNSGDGGTGDSGTAVKRGGRITQRYAVGGGLGALARGGQAGYNLGGYSDGGRLLRGPGDGVSDSIPATIGNRQPARLADGEFVIPARIVSELGNGSTEAGARKLYAMMDRVQKARGKTTGKNRVAANTRADKHLPA